MVGSGLAFWIIKKYDDDLWIIRFAILMVLHSETEKNYTRNQRRNISSFGSLETFGIYLDEFQEFL